MCICITVMCIIMINFKKSILKYRLRHSVSSSILIKYKLWPKWFVDETYYDQTGVWTKRLESSLTCIKLIVVSNIMSHVDKYNILYPFQHGFRKFRSSETQLIEFIDNVTRNLDDGKQTDVLIMDFSKVFDKVSHSLLINKLKHYGIRGKVNNWIESFLRQSLLRLKNLHTSLSILECPRARSFDQVCSYTT